MTFQCVEMAGPIAPVPVDPLVDLDETVGAQRVDPALGIGPHLDEADLPQHPKMAGHRRLGQAGQGGDELTRRPLTGGEGVEQGASAGFGNGLEDIHTPSIARDLYRCKPI